MLIRNAKLDGCSGLTDLRLMHGKVYEIGQNLVKGLYEAELNVDGDELHPWQGEPLPRPLQRRFAHAQAADCRYITPGSIALLSRHSADGSFAGFVHEHSAD